MVGLLLPDLVDAPLGGARVLHSITASVVVMSVVVLATIGRRPVRRRLLAIPIGMFLHLVLDGAFNDTRVFWWPFSGLPLPASGSAEPRAGRWGSTWCSNSSGRSRWCGCGGGSASRRRRPASTSGAPVHWPATRDPQGATC